MSESTAPADREARAAEKAVARAADTLRDRIVVAIIGFVMTGVLGTLVTTWIQQRGWTWQNRVAKIEKDVDNSITTYRAASDLVNARWIAAYRLTRAIEKKETGAEWKGALEAFTTADRDWALRFTNVAREVEFYVDTPFGYDSGANLPNVWKLTCNEYALPKGKELGIDTRSARAVLEIVNHCQSVTKDALQPIIDARAEGGAPAPADIEASALAFRRLDALYRVNDALRCIIFERALSIRGQLASESYWGTFFGVGDPHYVARGGRDCVGG